jgi:hypothetical protein
MGLKEAAETAQVRMHEQPRVVRNCSLTTFARSQEVLASLRYAPQGFREVGEVLASQERESSSTADLVTNALSAPAA